MPLLFGRTGHPTAWNPTSIAGCVLWLRADLGVTMDGSNRVSLWADQSGVGNDFAQATDAKKPVWGSNLFNGQDALTFDGVDDWLAKSDGLPIAQPCTFFILCGDMRVRDGNVNATFFRNSPLTCTCDILIYSGTSSKVRIYAGTSLASTTEDLVDLGDYILEYQFNTTSSQVYVNNDLKVSGNAGTGEYNGSLLYLSSYGTGGWMRGNFLEVLLYGGILGASDRTTLYSYFNTRYGL